MFGCAGTFSEYLGEVCISRSSDQGQGHGSNKACMCVVFVGGLKDSLVLLFSEVIELLLAVCVWTAGIENNRIFLELVVVIWPAPLPSTRQHPSYGDCLEVKREYYQNSSVLDCVTQCSQ